MYVVSSGDGKQQQTWALDPDILMGQCKHTLSIHSFTRKKEVECTT